MFKKKPAIKTLSPLRSSDRRKTADRIIADYGLDSRIPSSADDETAATAARSALRNAILPDNALSAKFETTHGPELKKIAGTVYVGGHSKGEQRVLWVKLEETLYPSVYTLWHNHGIMPLLHTPSFVIEKLQGGADLMTPGLAGPPFPAKAKKGAVVAVASLENPTVPLAVGTCLIDISSLTEARGAKGQAVEMFHCFGDHIWDWSTSGKPGIQPPTEIQGWAGDEASHLADQLDQLELEEKTGAQGGVSLQPDATNSAPPRNNFVDGEDIAEKVNMDEMEESISTADVDRAFKQAFLYGVHQQREEHRSAPKFGLAFPLSQSFVVSHLVNPYLPIFNSKQAESFTIKKTSWKNTKKFIKQLDKDKLILAKDTKTEMLVLDIDFDDVAFTSFQPYRLPKKEATSSANGTAESSHPSEQINGDDAIGQTLKVVNLFKPKDSLAPLLRLSPEPAKSSYTKAELAPLVAQYVESEGLVSATNKRLVKLDPFLVNSVFTSGSDADVLAKGSVSRDALVERVLATCSPFHVVLRNGAEVDSSKNKPRAGSAPRVQVVLETRGGNKTATRVSGFESYFIAAQPLADELRRQCAGSTAVEPLKGGKPGTLQVMVQGPQRDAVLRSLERRGVAKAWVDVVDKTKKK